VSQKVFFWPIPLDDFPSERELINYTLPSGLTCGPKLQIFETVIRTVAVLVVYVLTFDQRTI
jgi:hypothetical protein